MVDHWAKFAGYFPPPVPLGWAHRTYTNDACPSYSIGMLRIWVDHIDPEYRIDDGRPPHEPPKRFFVQLENDYWGSDGPILLETDDFEEVVRLADRSPLS